jgi:hypothetical protein
VDERDEESVARFLAAVAPIDELRSARSTEGEDEPVVDETDPVTPTPNPNPTQ